MITIKKNGARKPLAHAARPTIGYGMRIDINDGAYGVTLSAPDKNGMPITVHITEDEIDRLCNARDQWSRETKHRGRPVE